MKITFLTMLLLLPGGNWQALTRIRDRNAAVQQAAAAYQQGHYAQAAQAYRAAVELYGAQNEALLLNTAHALARAGQAGQAHTYYSRLLMSRVPRTRSIARQQLAVLAAAQGDYAQALGLLRKALLADPTNAEARYNFEALKNYLSQHEEEPQLPPPAAENGESTRPGDTSAAGQTRPKAGPDHAGELDSPNQPGSPPAPAPNQPDPRGQNDPNRPDASPGRTAQNQLQPGAGSLRAMARGSQPGRVRGLSDAAPGTTAPTTATSRRPGSEAAALDETQLQTQRERLQQMNLSLGQARQLLEALNAAEQQYLQQIPHKAIGKPDPGKPAW